MLISYHDIGECLKAVRSQRQNRTVTPKFPVVSYNWYIQEPMSILNAAICTTLVRFFETRRLCVIFVSADIFYLIYYRALCLPTLTARVGAYPVIYVSGVENTVFAWLVHVNSILEWQECTCNQMDLVTASLRFLSTPGRLLKPGLSWADAQLRRLKPHGVIQSFINSEYPKHDNGDSIEWKGLLLYL